MSRKFIPPDSIGLNELRIQKGSLKEFPVTKFHFPINHRRDFKKYLHQKDCILVVGGTQLFYVMRTNRNDSLKEEMPPNLNIEIGESFWFDELPIEIARRFLFSIIEEVAKGKGYIRGEGWQLYSPESQRENFSYGHYAVNIGIREEETYYSVFLDPTTLVLVPLTLIQPKYLEKGRVLRKLVVQEDKFRMESFDFSTYPGRAGYFDQFENSNIDKILPETLIQVRPRKNSDILIEYPAFALRLIAKRAEFGILGIDTINARKQMQPLPIKRLKETIKWAEQIFSESQVELNHRVFALENRMNVFEKAVRYSNKVNGNMNLYYPDVQLLFDSKGTKTNFSQKQGLKKYKPYDSEALNRPFKMIRPYLIIPGGEQTFRVINQLMDFLGGEYTRRSRTVFPDDYFNGLNEHFDVGFEIPDEDDLVVVEDATSIDYLQAADRILHSWATENGNEERIAIVVVPNYGENEDDPYIPLKKKFMEAGLPSQMIEMQTLEQVTNSSIPFGHTLWTLALDLYVKLGGKPWTLARPINDVNCLIGLGFGRSPRKLNNPIYVGIANVFDQGGQWLDLNSDDRELTDEEWQSLKDKEQNLKETSSFKLHHEMTAKIISNSLYSYNNNANQIARKVVFHKNGDIYESEALGFLQALSQNVLGNDLSLASAKFSLISIYKNHDLRMYGPRFANDAKMNHTITKGSVRILNENTAIIATTGKNPAGYFGIGTPKPIILQRYVPSDETFSNTGFTPKQMYTIEEICEHVFSLTRLHWGSTNDIHLPITSEYAQRIAEFLAKTDGKVDFLLKSKRLWWV